MALCGNNMVSYLQAKVNEQQREIHNLELAMQKVNTERVQKGYVDRLQADIARLQANLDEQKRVHDLLEINIKDYKSQLKDSMKNDEAARLVIAEKGEKIEQLGKDASRMQASIDAKDVLIESLQQQQSELRSQLAAQEASHETLRQCLKADLAKMNQKRSKLLAKVNTLAQVNKVAQDRIIELEAANAMSRLRLQENTDASSTASADTTKAYANPVDIAETRMGSLPKGVRLTLDIAYSNRKVALHLLAVAKAKGETTDELEALLERIQRRIDRYNASEKMAQQPCKTPEELETKTGKIDLKQHDELSE